MRVLRLLRIFIPLVLVAAIIAAVLVVLNSRSELQKSRRDVEDSWTPLRTDLDTRYQALGEANDAVKTIPGPLRVISTKTTSAYNEWKRLEQGHAGVGTEVNAANNLEALGRRLVLAARAAPRLRGQPALTAIAVYAGLQPPPTADEYNRAVDHFERERNRPARSLAAQLLGYDAIPAYAVTASSRRATTPTTTSTASTPTTVAPTTTSTPAT